MAQAVVGDDVLGDDPTVQAAVQIQCLYRTRVARRVVCERRKRRVFWAQAVLAQARARRARARRSRASRARRTPRSVAAAE